MDVSETNSLIQVAADALAAEQDRTSELESCLREIVECGDTSVWKCLSDRIKYGTPAQTDRLKNAVGRARTLLGEK